jgi:hypothetical protein
VIVGPLRPDYDKPFIWIEHTRMAHAARRRTGQPST